MRERYYKSLLPMIVSLSRFYHVGLVWLSHRPVKFYGGLVNPSDEARRYHAYLLRLWQTGEGESTVWRISVEDPRSGERRGFADLNSLFAFLNEICREAKRGN